MFYHAKSNTYIEEGKSFEINDTKYQFDVLSKLSAEQKSALGISEVIDIGKPEDEKYYYVSTQLVGNERRIVNIRKTDEQINQIEQSNLNAKSKQYLSDTDWYVIRMIETGIEIPSEVKQKRTEARSAINTAKDY